ncbi:HlyC/CorC family transporter [Nitrosopumilus sp. K4]|uniref:hemolysin family protein n=1 Tax=Nitrosopumilus sp. K4 TaxID=2795383 RepID=UPI001BA4F2F3|nr:hemolysin family protein [Nitrosopumilus sp. K4]QUC65271.1 HlyC/CorC family transporter [Nitrosopumilus sp. K4]
MELVQIEIILIVILIGLYALFSGLEIAIVGVRRSKVIRLYKKKVPGASPLYKLKMNPGMMTASVNLGNTLVNVASSILAADVAIKLLGDQGVGIAIGVMTFVILLFGEILPKTYSNVNPEKISLKFSGVLLVFTYLMYPFVKILELIIRGILRFSGGHIVKPRPITEEEIKEVAELGYEEKAIEKEEFELVRNALEFDDQPIKDVMTPKSQIFSLDGELTVSKVISEIKEKGFSRIPIFEQTSEDIIGIIHIWDISHLPEKEYKNTKLKQIARKPFFVNSKNRISNLLVELKKKDLHMAIVHDKNNKTVGLVTIEDLLEEIVGDIMGESKQQSQPETKS